MVSKTAIVCFGACILAIYLPIELHLYGSSSSSHICHKDVIKNKSVCHLLCPYGFFALPGMSACQPWLKCDAEIIPISTISISVVKTVYLVKWNDYEIVLSVLSAEQFEDDFQQNLFMLTALNSKQHIVELIGFCNNNILTKYYALGSALNFNEHMTRSLKSYDSITLRLSLCVSYVSAINVLHSSSVGTRVMCDSNTLEKTLSQFLLTDDLQLVVNDLDATPEVTENGVICGNRPLSGSFLAPEQLWPYEAQEYDSKKMAVYDEKTDIWKVPDVCNWFLGQSSDVDIIKYKLFFIHKSCKNVEPSLRPTAAEILNVYNKVYDGLS